MSVTLNTTFGPITIELFVRDTPLTCRNFLELCKAGYYDGCIFHRVIPGYIAQTGDPSGKGTGGESIYGPTFNDEISAKLSHSTPGIVSMANGGTMNSNSSQFFFTFKQNPYYDGKYTVFGKVSKECLDVLHQFEVIRIARNKKPLKPVKIFSTEVANDPWQDQPLPHGSKIPEKPLLSSKNCSVQ
eukprot:Phypoly_transcript_18251.p1 GENE.Phypoly_transcript_18251~~Phypoly_transcript_18251.p1  ORF type:complete len:186 (+),score=9.85 Phypoly_transcript_18251:157-714(+)